MSETKVTHRLDKSYKDWNHGEGLVLIEAWARDGLTNEQIAENIGVKRQTFQRWIKDHNSISDTLKKGKEVVDINVENALYKKALGYNVELKKTFKVRVPVYDDNKKLIGWGEELQQGIDEVHVPADTVAQIYWLKNRKPVQWRDKIEQTIKVEHKGDELLEAIKQASGNLFTVKDLEQEDKS